MKKNKKLSLSDRKKMIEAIKGIILEDKEGVVFLFTQIKKKNEIDNHGIIYGKGERNSLIKAFIGAAQIDKQEFLKILLLS